MGRYKINTMKFQYNSEFLFVGFNILSKSEKQIIKYFIEKKINSEYDENVLIAHELENDYFFPTQDRKIVVAVLNKGFTWFSFVTLFITLYGISSYIWAMVQIVNNDLNIIYIYLVSAITFITLVIGYWWFVSGTGEKRLEKVFNKHG